MEPEGLRKESMCAAVTAERGGASVARGGGAGSANQTGVRRIRIEYVLTTFSFFYIGAAIFLLVIATNSAA